MDPGSLTQVISFVKQIYRAFPLGKSDTHVGLVICGSGARVMFNLNSYRTVRQLDAAFARVRRLGGNLRIEAGFRVAQTQLFRRARKGIPNVLIAITNGIPSGNYISASASARISGILVYAIGTSRTFVQRQMLNAMGTTPKFTALVTRAQGLFRKIRSCIGRIGQGNSFC